jgi:prevent-host-death family protein
MITTVFTAKEAKNNFGRLLDEARRFPVAVSRSGRTVAVVMSYDEYDEFEKKRDLYWGQLAKRAEKGGYIGKRKSAKIIQSALNASR